MFFILANASPESVDLLRGVLNKYFESENKTGKDYRLGKDNVRKNKNKQKKNGSGKYNK